MGRSRAAAERALLAPSGMPDTSPEATRAQELSGSGTTTTFNITSGAHARIISLGEGGTSRSNSANNTEIRYYCYYCSDGWRMPE